MLCYFKVELTNNNFGGVLVIHYYFKCIYHENMKYISNDTILLFNSFHFLDPSSITISLLENFRRQVFFKCALKDVME